jgi:hypothetical protein
LRGRDLADHSSRPAPKCDTPTFKKEKVSYNLATLGSRKCSFKQVRVFSYFGCCIGLLCLLSPSVSSIFCRVLELRHFTIFCFPIILQQHSTSTEKPRQTSDSPSIAGRFPLQRFLKLIIYKEKKNIKIEQLTLPYT